MSDETNGSGDFVRITNRMVWDKLVTLEQDMQEIKGLVKRVSVLENQQEKLQARFNGVLTGIGAGLAVGLIAFFRGLVGN